MNLRIISKKICTFSAAIFAFALLFLPQASSAQTASYYGGAYTVQYLGTTFAGGNTTFSYKACVAATPGMGQGFSHVTFGVSACQPGLNILSCTQTGSSSTSCRIETDPTTGVYGVKWNTNSAELDTIGECLDFAYTLQGIVGVGPVPVVVKVGNCNLTNTCESQSLPGPICTFPSPSPSSTPSVVPSSTPSASPSVSPSVSSSPSPSPQVSPSPSPSHTPSVSPSVSPSASPSVSPSTSPSVSPSASPSVSSSASPSSSPTPEQSPGVSPSASVSPSSSPSASPSPEESPVPPVCGITGTSPICASAVTSVAIDASTSSDPDGSSLTYNWSHDCGPSATLNSDPSNPMASLELSDPGLGIDSICSVMLTVVDSDGQSDSCEYDLSVAGCALDCAGIINGTSQIDRCGICDGDGTACLDCVATDVFDSLFTMDGSAFAQKRHVQKIAKILRRMTKNPSAGVEESNTASGIYTDSWTVTWNISQVNLECANESFCIAVSNTGSVETYRANANTLYDLARSLTEKLKKRGKRGKRKAIKLNKRSKRLRDKSLAILDQIPAQTDFCS